MLVVVEWHKVGVLMDLMVVIVIFKLMVKTMRMLVVEQVVKVITVVVVIIFLVDHIQMQLVEVMEETHHIMVDVDKQVEVLEDIMVVVAMVQVE